MCGIRKYTVYYMVNYYALKTKTGEIIGKYKGHCPVHACKKIFYKYLHNLKNDCSIKICIISLNNNKEYYYNCIGLYNNENPIVKHIGNKTIKCYFTVKIMKIIKEMVD